MRTTDNDRERNMKTKLTARQGHVKGSRTRCAAVRDGSQLAFGACLVAVLLATANLTAGAAWGASGGLPGTGDRSFNPAADSEGNHCVSPEGVDANELLGVSEHLVIAGDACGPVRTGEFYVPFNPACWGVSTSWEVMPGDYTPAAATPAEDFMSKVRSISYVVDPGTRRARSYRFEPKDVMTVGRDRDLFPVSGTDGLLSVCFLPKLPPLPAGDHALDAFVEMSARSCDGLGADESFNCLPAGTTRLCRIGFTVEQGPASKSGR